MTETKVLTLPASGTGVRSSQPVALRLNLIGQMEATAADRSSVLPLGRKTRALLAILALSAPRPVGRARLAELLWSRRHEEQARASLRQEIHRLLDALQPAGSEILTITRDHVLLRLDQVSIDVEDVLRATPADAAGLDLLKGRLLDEFDGIDPAFDLWLAAERERLQDTARAVAEGVLRQQVDAEAMIQVAQRLLTIDRAHEGAWRALMGAYAERGDRGMAVQAYERCRAVLKEKLDSAPSPETQRLLAGIRAGDAAITTRPEMPAPEPAAPAPPGIRIGVLPFQMLGGDPANAHLSHSLADEVTAALSAFRFVYPVSSAALQQYGSRDEAVLGRAFSLGFLVDGSVQHAGHRLRVTVRLLDLDDGSRVAWAQRFDREMGDLLSLQDEVAAEVAGQILPEIMLVEHRRAMARPLSGASAYDLVLRATPLLFRLRRNEFDEAGELLRRALAVEPDFAPAHAWRAYWLTLQASQGWADDLDLLSQQAREHAERAVALDPRDGQGLAIAGHVRALLHRQPQEAMELHERALALNPNIGMSVALSAVTLTFLGELDAAAQSFARYARLAPLGPSRFFADAMQTMVEILRQDPTAAVRFGRRATELNPNYVLGLKIYLSALGHAGLVAEAKLVLRRVMTIEPSFSTERSRVLLPLHRPADIAQFEAGLRMAGVPDGRLALVTELAAK